MREQKHLEQLEQKNSKSDFPAFIDTVAVVIQAIVACILLIFVIQQTRISRNQAEFLRSTTIKSEYHKLSDTRQLFWSSLRKLSQGLWKVDLPLVGLMVLSGGFPEGLEPAEIDSLPEWIREHEDDLEAELIWHFVKVIHPITWIPEDEPENIRAAHMALFMEIEDIRSAQRDLSDFWDKWVSMTNVTDYIRPDRKELIMLTWLELAHVRSVADPGEVAKTRPFVGLAKSECAIFSKIDRSSQKYIWEKSMEWAEKLLNGNDRPPE